MKKIACIYMRGGTSKGPFFDLRDLPQNPDERAQVLLRIMGSPDANQINGIGGAKTVTSKVVMVQPSQRENIDVDYLFAQVFINDAIVDTKPTCGNMMSGVAPFAVEKGWVDIAEGRNKVLVYNINTDSTAEMQLDVCNGAVNYTEGDLKIDGVPGTGSPILMNLSNIAGGATGKLFPTGKLKDKVQGIELTMFDAGNLMIHMRAKDFGLTGDEKGDYFKDKPALMEKMESIRREIAREAGMGDVSNSVLPKIGLLCPPSKGGSIRSMYFTPKTYHPTHAVSGAVCVTAASRCEGTIASEMIHHPAAGTDYILEHQSGSMPIKLITEGEGLNFNIVSAGTYRTARKLMEGFVYY